MLNATELEDREPPLAGANQGEQAEGATERGFDGQVEAHGSQLARERLNGPPRAGPPRIDPDQSLIGSTSWKFKHIDYHTVKNHQIDLKLHKLI
ncbi:hypothetical protein [Methylobacterium sp. SD21]|uniref:hypothetical protein n=1 Tax=Methylobacterium litchii TaxID=3138810 RepID=UPI00313DFCA6